MRPRAHRFLDFVEKFPPASPTLPVMHTCLGRQFIDILETRTINIGDMDPVINKSASFFFYGKPSYRPRNDGSFNRKMHSALFCFLIDLSKAPTPDGILPFDSGGYNALLKEIFGNASPEEFYLRQDIDSPGRLVSAFFGNNKSYYHMEIRDGVKREIGKLDLHSEGLIDICSSTGSVDYDQRAASIELHYSKPILLRPENLLAIVAPDAACDDEDLQNLVRDLDADLVEYVLDLDDTNSRQRDVKKAVLGWLEAKGLM